MDRPLECSSCTKEISTKFCIVSHKHEVVYTCDTCPVLQNRLGACDRLHKSCDVCSTSFAEALSSNAYGCPSCYDTFFSSPLRHTGDHPLQQEASPFVATLDTLEKSLQEALAQEKYEEAAWIRDQIRNMTGS